MSLVLLVLRPRRAITSVITPSDTPSPTSISPINCTGGADASIPPAGAGASTGTSVGVGVGVAVSVAVDVGVTVSVTASDVMVAAGLPSGDGKALVAIAAGGTTYKGKSVDGIAISLFAA